MSFWQWPTVSFAFSLWRVLGVGLFILAGTLGWSLYGEYSSTDARERERLMAQAKVVEENLNHQLLATNRALDAIRNDLTALRAQQGGMTLVTNRLNAMREAMPGTRAITLFDAHGTLIARSPDAFVGQDFSQRDYFQVPRHGGDMGTLYVTPPFLAKTGEYVVNMSKVLLDDHGAFAGVILTSLDPSYFSILMDSVRYAPDMLISLAHGDGNLFLLVPPNPGSQGKDVSKTNGFFSRHIASGQQASVMTGHGSATGRDLVVAARTIRPAEVPMDKPLVLFVSRDPRIIFAPWRKHLSDLVLLFFLLTGVATLGLYFMQRRQRAYDRLVAEQEALRNQTMAELRIAAAAFDSQEAMVVTDANSVILRVNRAFTEITGYLPEEVVGQNPRVLKSNRHAPDFYRAMWETINRTGGWQGEIWDRRKNGEEYPKWLTISSVRDGSGNITHYIGAHFDITERKKAEEKIEALAFFDQLTGLPNRFSLQERLTQAQSLAGRNEKQLAVMLIDLDNFKTINDTLGHQMGDKLLTQVAIRLADSIRQSDLVARLGGDEFVVVLPEIDSPADAANVADKILKAVSAPYLVDGHQLRTSPSIGICLFPGDATETQDLIKKADVAMYHAKAKGRGNYQFFKEEIQAAAVKRLAIEADLRTALAKQQFVLYYQPQLDLRTGRLVGVEALVRWQHPERGLVPPDDFIPIAEETGLILPMGDWVIQKACRQLADWRAGGIEHIRISVNLSASQFLDRELPYLIQAQMKKYALSPESLDLEVTESMTMASPENTIVSMKVLKENGLTLSIDDFGTGYSSLSYLKMFPISTLKIDRSFVKDIETDQNDADICDVTVLLAHKLGMDVVAEGVETKAQLKYLQSIGCEKIQGYLISKPLPADKAEEFIRSHQPMTGLGTVDVWKYS